MLFVDGDDDDDDDDDDCRITEGWAHSFSWRSDLSL